MILEKLEKMENFTETEKTIAQYILNTENSIVGMTSSKLGKVTYTSQAAVVRLYKKLGINSYRTFHSLLLEELTERKNMLDIDCFQPIKMNMSVDDVITTLTKYYINTIYDTKLSIDKNKIQRLYNHLRNAKCVQIYNDGSATFISKELSNKISTFGIHCRTIETMNEFRMRYFKPGEKVAIFISLDNNTKILKEMAQTLLNENYYIFGMLNNKNNDLSLLCHDVVYIGETNCQNINNSYRAMYIVDIIYSMLLSHYNEK